MNDTPRSALTERRRETFDGLLDAARELLVEAGFEGLSVRAVAARAGVTHTTAYSFVTSKSQLIAELYLREMERLEPVRVRDASTPVERVVEALEGPATLFADDPAVAHAVQVALLVGDTEEVVRRLRARIGSITLGRLRAALGDAPNELVELVFSAFNGAMLLAGTGYRRYDEVASIAAQVLDPPGLDTI